MNPHRPRRRRRSSPIPRLVADWARLVSEIETARDNSWCPCHGCTRGNPRAHLEAIIRRGGRQGRRVRALVRPLDDRYDRVVYDHCRAGLWWYRAFW